MTTWITYRSRIEEAMAEYANSVRFHGMVSWEGPDFGSYAQSFLVTLRGTVKVASVVKVETYRDFLVDLEDHLPWSLPEPFRTNLIRVAFNEIGPDLLPDLDFPETEEGI